jgi:tripartite-type tricarboxylate transporter receptor subunit TctC
MNKRFSSLIIIGLTLISSVTFAAGPFYEGKTIRIIVGFAAGGGFDLYARAFARHMGKYIPGNPTIIVENMTGAGSLISANYLYKVAKPDGLTLGHFSGGLFLSQLLEQSGIEFDSKKFEFIGAANKEDNVCVLNKASGITSIDKWMISKRLIKLGGLGSGSTFDNTIRILKTGVGLPIQLISGYRGASDIRLAVESGELDGGLWTWDTLKATWRKVLDSGDIVVVLQTVPKPLPDLPNVPLAINLAKTDEARQMIEVCIHSPSIFSRPFVLPPGAPNEQVQILRKAFQETLKDKEFLEETKKAQLGLNPVTWDELE